MWPLPLAEEKVGAGEFWPKNGLSMGRSEGHYGEIQTDEITPHHQKRPQFRGLFRPESPKDRKAD
jgi:hypothetical protein